MKILILGGTGAMGHHLVQLLADRGEEVTVTSRSARSSQERLRYIQGDAKEMGFLSAILNEEHWDVIVDFMVYSTRAFKERIRALLEATSHYVFLSSSRVYAQSGSPLTETSPRLLDVSPDATFLASDEYSLSKARQEDILRHSGKDHWTVIRPYITYSEERLQLGVLEKEEWLYRALRGRTIVFSKDIHSKSTTMTYGGDVAAAIAHVVGQTAALGEVFHITAAHSVAWADVLALYLEVLEKHLGQRPKVLLQNLKQFMRCKHSKYQIIYDRLFDRRFDSSKIYQLAGMPDFTPADAGLKRCLEQFLDQPRFREIDWITEALMDRQTRERAPFREIKGLEGKLCYCLFRYFGAPPSFRRLAVRVRSLVLRTKHCRKK
ncbi:MAG: NAD-dependent epimerase/dehydratase family protein [Kiritimatiellales bacterium]